MTPNYLFDMHGHLVVATNLGPQDDFFYDEGYSVTHIERFTEADIKALVDCRHGGMKTFQGGMTIEEPFIHMFKSQDYLPKDSFYEQSQFQGPWSIVSHKLDCNHIQVFSRTLYVGNLCNTNKYELADYFNYNDKIQIESLEYVDARHCCFLKLKTRKMAELVLKAYHLKIYNNNVIKIGFACGFGPKEAFDYKKGVSMIPVYNLTQLDHKLLKASNIILKGSQIIDEPMAFLNK
eukprot:NODE_141_length_15967_cov_0.946118.p6 type:complete len:235 gc:universal NODE_141_length_15967_cov_0.946118:15256-15960(+)